MRRTDPFKYFRAALSLAVAFGLQGCVVPRYMHVTEGMRPDEIDKDVRFRTTYYYRVFDFCSQPNVKFGDLDYRKVVPQSDTLYRYRMTGKASALFSKIKFEAGTLQATEIDPFGAELSYDPETGSTIALTRQEVKQKVLDAAAARAAAAANEVDLNSKSGSSRSVGYG